MYIDVREPQEYAWRLSAHLSLSGGRKMKPFKKKSYNNNHHLTYYELIRPSIRTKAFFPLTIMPTACGLVVFCLVQGEYLLWLLQRLVHKQTTHVFLSLSLPASQPTWLPKFNSVHCVLMQERRVASGGGKDKRRECKSSDTARRGKSESMSAKLRNVM